MHKVRLLQISEREKLPRLKTNSKLIKFQVIEELLEEDEMSIIYINDLIYAAATIMTQILNLCIEIQRMWNLKCTIVPVMDPLE